MTDNVIRIGLKAAIDDEGKVEGWLAPFGGPMKGGRDLDGEFFGPETDFALDYYPTIPVLYAHGQNGDIGATKVGDISLKEIRDKGLWVQGELDKQSKYYDVLRELAEKGDLYWSSGSLAHLVTKNARTGAIKQWPVAEATLTLTPSNVTATAALKESQTFTIPSGAGVPLSVTWTFGDEVKEGRRNNASDQQLIQTMHDHAVSLGAQCAEPDADEPAEKSADPEPEPEPAGEAKDAPPADVLTISVGNAVAKPPTADLDLVKASLMEFARAEGRRLTG